MTTTARARVVRGHIVCLHNDGRIDIYGVGGKPLNLPAQYAQQYAREAFPERYDDAVEDA